MSVRPHTPPKNELQKSNRTKINFLNSFIRLRSQFCGLIRAKRLLSHLDVPTMVGRSCASAVALGCPFIPKRLARSEN